MDLKVALSFGAGSSEKKRAPYRAALRAVGLEPVEDADTLEGMSGLVLTGGTDVDPSLYGESRGPYTDEPDRERDSRESGLLMEALDRDLPVLAICRGMQLFNVALGGSLDQHIEGHRQEGEINAHTVRITPGSRLADILTSGEYAVNSAPPPGSPQDCPRRSRHRSRPGRNRRSPGTAQSKLCHCRAVASRRSHGQSGPEAV